MQAVPVCCQCDVSCAAGSTAPAGVFLCLRKVQTTRYIPTLSTPTPRSAGLQVKYHKCFANTLPSTWHNYPDSVQPVQPVQCCWSSQRITSWWFLRVTVDSWRSSTWLELVVNIITDQLLTPPHHSHYTLVLMSSNLHTSHSQSTAGHTSLFEVCLMKTFYMLKDKYKPMNCSKNHPLHFCMQCNIEEVEIPEYLRLLYVNIMEQRSAQNVKEFCVVWSI